MNRKNDDFQFEIIEAGQRDKFGSKYFEYKITSCLPEKDVRKYCTTV